MAAAAAAAAAGAGRAGAQQPPVVAAAAAVAKPLVPSQRLSVAFVGAADSGKTRLWAQCLYRLGGIDKRTIEKFEAAERDAGRGGFKYPAWGYGGRGSRCLPFALFERELESPTVDSGHNTRRWRVVLRRHDGVTLMDTPGNTRYLRNVCTALAEADAALIVVDARPGAFEKSAAQPYGALRQHVLCAYAYGIQQLIVAVSLGMYGVSSEALAERGVQPHSRARYDQCVSGVRELLASVGYNTKGIAFVPCDVGTGEGVVNGHHSGPHGGSMPWYDGPDLLTALDACHAVDELAPLPPPSSANNNNLAQAAAADGQCARAVGAALAKALAGPPLTAEQLWDGSQALVVPDPTKPQALVAAAALGGGGPGHHRVAVVAPACVPLRFPVRAVHKIGGIGTVVCGRVASGVLRCTDVTDVMSDAEQKPFLTGTLPPPPASHVWTRGVRFCVTNTRPGGSPLRLWDVPLSVRSIEWHHTSVDAYRVAAADTIGTAARARGAIPGWHVGANVHGVSVRDVRVGMVMGHADDDPPCVALRFVAQCVVLDTRNPLPADDAAGTATAAAADAKDAAAAAVGSVTPHVRAQPRVVMGSYAPQMCAHTDTCAPRWTHVLARVHKRTGAYIPVPPPAAGAGPQQLRAGQVAMVELVPPRNGRLCVEPHGLYPRALSRIAFLDGCGNVLVGSGAGGATYAADKVVVAIGVVKAVQRCDRHGNATEFVASSFRDWLLCVTSLPPLRADAAFATRRNVRQRLSTHAPIVKPRPPKPADTAQLALARQASGGASGNRQKHGADVAAAAVAGDEQADDAYSAPSAALGMPLELLRLIWEYNVSLFHRHILLNKQ